jgi:hypothetical protein
MQSTWRHTEFPKNRARRALAVYKRASATGSGLCFGSSDLAAGQSGASLHPGGEPRSLCAAKVRIQRASAAVIADGKAGWGVVLNWSLPTRVGALLERLKAPARTLSFKASQCSP